MDTHCQRGASKWPPQGCFQMDTHKLLTLPHTTTYGTAEGRFFGSERELPNGHLRGASKWTQWSASKWPPQSCFQMDSHCLTQLGASKWPPTGCLQMDTRALKDFALNVSTFARQPAQLRGFRIRGSREFSGPEIHTAGARACADHGLSPTNRGNRVKRLGFRIDLE